MITFFDIDFVRTVCFLFFFRYINYDFLFFIIYIRVSLSPFLLLSFGDTLFSSSFVVLFIYFCFCFNLHISYSLRKLKYLFGASLSISFFLSLTYLAILALPSCVVRSFCFFPQTFARDLFTV